MKIVNKLTAQKSYKQLAYLGIPYNLIHSGNLDKYYQILTNFDFLMAKISHPNFGVQALINDYNLIDFDELLNNPEYQRDKVEVLKLVQATLRLSAHILNEDKTQLASQLMGRLLSFEQQEIQLLLQQAEQNKTSKFVPLKSCLNKPTGRVVRTLTGHNDAVLAVTVTNDGKRLISASSDNTLKTWNLETGSELLTFVGHRDKVLAVAVTSDGKKLISSSQDKTLKVWNLETGKEIFTLEGHAGKVSSVAVTPDNKLLISGSWDGTIRVWNLEAAKEMFIFPGLNNLITAVVVTPDGQRVISASSDTTLTVWDLEKRKKLFVLEGHVNTVSALAITRDGKRLISASWDKTIKVWNIVARRGLFGFILNLITRRQLLTITGHKDRVTAVVVTSDSKRIISDSLDNHLKVWDAETGQELFSLKEHTNELNPIAITPDDKWMISGSEDKTLTVWRLETDDKAHFLEDIKHIKAIEFTPDAKRVITICEDNNLIIWNSENGAEINRYKNCSNLSFAILNFTSVVFLLNGIIDVWNRETYNIQLINENKCVSSVIFNPYNKRLVVYRSWTIDNFDDDYSSLRFKQNLKIYDVLAKKDLFTLIDYDSIVTYERFVNPVIVTPDGRGLISRSSEKNLKMWSLDTGQEILNFPSRISRILALAITPDGKWIIAGLADKKLQVWNLKTLDIMFILEGQDVLINTLAVTPDSKYVIYGSIDKFINVVDISTGQKKIKINNEYAINKITITLDGKWIISESIKNKLPLFRVWSLSRGKEVFTLSCQSGNTLQVENLSQKKIIASFTIEDRLKCYALAPDGMTIVAGDDMGQINFLHLKGVEGL